ncbi:hypothetical protein E2C01_013928 [Portunus trituberculatus]|uniref:Uncharacterized protein n=1 Tax=Portunus trituberculatus TaxID=210409 RepID=A0A5B7DHH4_PORTR|nr:hypothetical protein [Portunus trituberculatus]
MDRIRTRALRDPSDPKARMVPLEVSCKASVNVMFKCRLQAVLRSVRKSVWPVAKSIGEGWVFASVAALSTTVFPMTSTWEGTH